MKIEFVIFSLEKTEKTESNLRKCRYAIADAVHGVSAGSVSEISTGRYFNP